MDTSGSHVERQGRIGRAAPLVGLAGRTAGEAVVASLRRRRRGASTAEFHERNAERYAEHLGRSKGVLMKAGQILSFTTLGAAVPDSSQTVYQRALARLQDSAPPMPPEMAAEVIEAELGAAPDVVFAEFDPVPLGAASIGQVHAATLHDGRRVAVKVQYPGVAAAIKADLQNTELLATFLNMVKSIVPNSVSFDVRTVAAEVSERIGEEIDYRIEARNQAAFADAYRGHPFIHIPEVVPELSTARVLTMDLAEGRRFAEAVKAEAALRDSWGEVIFRFALGSVRRLRLFHADPHPGNYLFHDDGSVTFLDFGCVKRIDPKRVRLLKSAINAAVDGRPDDLMTIVTEMGFFDGGDKPEPVAVHAWFAAGMEALTAPQPATYDSATMPPGGDKFSPVGPHADVVRRMTIDPEYTMFSRIDLGLLSVLGVLRCTAPWEAIRSEWDRGGPPATRLGELDSEFWSVKV